MRIKRGFLESGWSNRIEGDLLFFEGDLLCSEDEAEGDLLCHEGELLFHSLQLLTLKGPLDHLSVNCDQVCMG